MCFPYIVNTQSCKRSPAGIYSTISVGGSQYFDSDKVRCTFANVIVDVVARGAGNPSLTDVTPSCVHAALVGLAGIVRQTLICVYCLKRGEETNV